MLTEPERFFPISLEHNSILASGHPKSILPPVFTRTYSNLSKGRKSQEVIFAMNFFPEKGIYIEEMLTSRGEI
jgi:hypothetical protein